MVALAVLGSSALAGPAGGPVAGGNEVRALLAGIPQAGLFLGSKSAPVTVIEIADLQCPYCRQFMLLGLPGIVHDYVRTGRVRLAFNGVSILGPDSTTALDATLAAGRQNRLWNFAELLYRNQGRENSGWVTDGLLLSAAQAVPGLDVRRWQADRRSAFVTAERGYAEQFAQNAGVPGTPAFLVTRAGRKPIPVLASVPGPIRAAIERQLRPRAGS